MGCSLATSYSSTCATKKKKNGLQGDVYLFNLKGTDGNNITFTQGASPSEISDIVLAGSDVGYKLAGSKLMHTYSSDLTVPTRGNQFYLQNLILKFLEDSAADLEFTLELVAAESLVAVIETYNGKYIILGMGNGLSSVEGTMFTFDVDPAADVATSVPLSSEEDYHKAYFFDTDAATTKTKLEGYLTA